jgi:DNA-binding response OmpR family regulator
MKVILIVEDEPSISRVLAAYLRKAEYSCEICADGSQAIKQFNAIQPDLVLLDVMLPGLDGWGVLAEIRRKSACPVIMLTAREDVQDRLSGLNNGADDYITKPFIPDEVVARVNAVLRRPVQSFVDSGLKYFGSLKIDFKAREVFLNGASLSITPKDIALLLFLAEHPNQLFHREQLIEKVWGMDYEGSDRAVDLAIKRLRKVMLHWPIEEGEIRTLRGTGYQFYAHKNN